MTGEPARRVMWVLAFVMLFLTGSTPSAGLHEGRYLTHLAAAAGSALCAMLRHPLVDYLLWALACSALFWTLPGFVAASARQGEAPSP
ncbi:MAG: hypothetical protein QHJ73_18825 [Armatimonadota bacterium]|nr:hypothetical protein [Armatimonadota bacterium]